MVKWDTKYKPENIHDIQQSVFVIQYQKKRET